MRKPRRHLDFFALMEALSRPGCPACRLADRAGRRFLETLFYEQVNDPTLRGRLRRAGGFCREHAEIVVASGDALGSSIIYADLLAEAVKSWQGGTPQRCLACRAGEEAVRRALEALVSHVAEEDVKATYRDSDGLCLPHLQQLRHGAESPGAAALVQMETERLARLAEQCAEFVRKADYRRAHEPLGPERNAWQRAARKLGGGFPHDEPQ